MKNVLSEEKLEQDLIPKVFPTDLIDNEQCETIHIGLVCSGSTSILFFHTLLKSIYFYRVNPIHFHIITNKVSENILRSLFDSWHVPQGKYYEISAYHKD